MTSKSTVFDKRKKKKRKYHDDCEIIHSLDVTRPQAENMEKTKVSRVISQCLWILEMMGGWGESLSCLL